MDHFILFAVALLLIACSEPSCPSGYMKYGDLCRRCPPGQERERGQCVSLVDAGSAAFDGASDFEVDEEPSIATTPDAANAGGSLDASTTAFDAEAMHDADNGPGFAADAFADARAVAPSDAMAADSMTVADGNVAVNDCRPNPCQRGGTCIDEPSGFRCECPSGSTGTLCELDICGETTILSRAGLNAAKSCAEIRGKLSISSSGFSSVTATDLPNLTRVTGDLVIGAVAGAERSPLLETVTLAQLQRVEGMLFVGGNQRGAVRELHMPALTSIGSGPASAPGLRLLQTESVVVEFPVLGTINGSVEIRDFLELCTFKAAALTRITGSVLLFNVINVIRNDTAVHVDRAFAHLLSRSG